MVDERLIQYDFDPPLSVGDGATSENGRVKQSELLANFDDISYGIFKFRYKGTDLKDRASDATTCVVWLVTDSGAKLGATAGEKAYIRYSTGHLWEVDVAEDGGDPYISFTDTDLQSPAASGIADYSSGAFIDALTVLVTPIQELASNSSIVFVGEGAVTGSDIARSSSDTTKVDTKITTLETQADSVIETAGGLKSNTVTATVVQKTGAGAAFANDLPKNIILDGSAEKYIYNKSIAYGFEATVVAATSYSKEDTIVSNGTYSQKFTTGAGGVGLKVLLDPEEAGISSPGASQIIGKDLAGKNITIACWYRSDVANNVEIGIWDDVGGYDTTVQTVLADTWTLISVTKTVTAASVEVYGIIRSSDATATAHYVDAASIFPGETTYEIGRSVNASIVNNELAISYYNMIPYGDLMMERYPGAPGDDGNFFGHAWLSGSAAAPIGWTSDGVTRREESDFKYGNASWDMKLDAGESSYLYIGGSSSISYPAVQECRGRWCTYSLWIKRDGVGNTTDITIRINTNGTSGGNTDVDFTVNDYDAWQQVAVSAYVPTDCTSIQVSVRNDSGATIDILTDGFMFKPIPYPSAFVSATGWRLVEYTFSKSGVLSGSAISPNIFNHEGLAIGIPIGMNLMIVGMSAHVDTAADIASTATIYPIIFEWDNGAGTWDAGTPITQVQTVFTTGDYYRSNGCYASPGILGAGSLLKVGSEMSGPSPPEDCMVTVHCLVWGP